MKKDLCERAEYSGSARSAERGVESARGREDDGWGRGGHGSGMSAGDMGTVEDGKLSI